MSATSTVQDPVWGRTIEREVEAECTLEHPVKCPHCSEDLDTLAVVRLLRTRVNFTSTLPRRGRMLVCPHCKKVISAEPAGFA